MKTCNGRSDDGYFSYKPLLVLTAGKPPADYVIHYKYGVTCNSNWGDSYVAKDFYNRVLKEFGNVEILNAADIDLKWLIDGKDTNPNGKEKYYILASKVEAK